MQFDSIELDIADGVARLVLDRPDSLNSFTASMHEEVHAALDTVDSSDGVRCLVITGRGRGFCAGQDLGDRSVQPGGEAPDLGASLEDYYNPLIRRLRALPMPVVAAVNGVAAGAGANIALACDLVIARRSAAFIQAFCRLGLLPDSGGTWHLPRLVGHARAMGLALLGDKLSAEDAQSWGLIWKVVDDDRFDAEIDTLVAHLANQPTAGLAAIKEAMQASWHNTLDEQLDLERDLQRRCGRSADYREGVAAFMAKRKPTFVGR